ncbi:MAG: hypothetical protein KME64_42605 [Scytonematopsis contorta HA4267-MV1]|jgi:hypothetical protein|nr:hypothetical protein [Scytonematopsis contorta HA4267-MV1]
MTETANTEQSNKQTEATNLDKSPTRPNSEIVVIVDLGASKTKVIFQEYPLGEPQVICIDSTVADVGLDSLTGLDTSGLPEDNCWVSLPNEGSYALGYLAAKKFHGSPMLRSLKFDLALPKIAGVLWVVSQKLTKKTKLLKVRLCVLLPPSEGGDSKALGEKLKTLLEEFTTPTGVLRVKLVDFKAMREGFGIACHHRSVLGDDEFQKRNIAIVMIGYRNLSVLEFVRGKLTEGASCDLGMSWLVNSFVQAVGAGLSVDDPKVLQALVGAGSDCNSAVLAKLSRKRKGEDLTADGEKFSKIAMTERSNYVNAVIRWLSQNINDGLDSVIFCGGTAQYISDELCEYYDNLHIPVEWDGGIVVPDVLDKLGMGERLADALGLYQYYVTKLDESKKKDGAARLKDMVLAYLKAKKEASEEAKAKEELALIEERKRIKDAEAARLKARGVLAMSDDI